MDEAKACPRTTFGRGTGSGLFAGLIVLLVTAGLAYGLWRGLLRGDRTALAAGLLTYRVEPIDLVVTATETGTLMSASSVQVYSEVDGRVAIVSIVPDGTRVEAGDVVVELESAQLKTARIEQQIAVEKARAALSQAQQDDIVVRSQSESDVQGAALGVEFAELDLDKYLEGDYPVKLRELQSEIALAEEELERANAPLPVLEELNRDGYLNDNELAAERSRAKRAQSRVEIARDHLHVLEKYEFQRQKRDLESKVTEARRAHERVKNLAQAALVQAKTRLGAEESALRLEEDKLARLEDQIEKCILRAPNAGFVVYPVPVDDEALEYYITEGNEVRRRQHVFSIPDTDALEVHVAFNEAVVNDIRPGMPARIRIDVGGLDLRGEVKFVSKVADPQDWRRTTVKFYQTKISLTDPLEGLRPGMTAMVEVLIERQPDVLALPVQAVVQRGDAGLCYVVQAGVPALRKLKLGRASVSHIAVVEGIQAGELVLLAPDEIGIPADAFEEEASASSAAFLESPAPAASGATTDDATVPLASGATAEVPIEETEYEAIMLGPDGATAEAEYEIQVQSGVVIKRKFELEVKGGPPGATWEVELDGVVFGTVTLDATGYAVGEWSTKDSTLPPEFPVAAATGSRVRVGEGFEGTLTQ